MKRVLGILLSITLLLTLFGCGKTPFAESDTTTSSAPTETVPTTETTTVPDAEKAVFSLRTLPDIGAFVSDEKKAYFFDDGAHDTFEPRKDYGKIVPYCTTEKYFATDWSYTDEETGEVYQGSTPEDESGYYERFGFATADGKIITNGLYDDLFCYEDETGAVLYVAFPEQAYEMCGEMYLIAGDGSSCVHLTENDSELRVFDESENGSGKGLLLIRNYESERLRLMDFSGKVLYEYNPSSPEDNDYMVYIEYADQNSVLIRQDDNEGVSRYFRQTYDGKEIAAFPEDLGMMRGVHGNEVVIMGSWNDWYRLVSMDGKVLSDDYLELEWSDYYNCFFGVNDGEMECYDADGKKLKDRSNDSFGALDSDYNYNYLYDPETCSLLDTSFQPVPLTVDNGQIVLVESMYNWEEPGDCKLLVRTDTDDLYVFSNSGERLAKFRDVLYDAWDSDEDGVNDEVKSGVEERNYDINEEGDMIFAKKEKEIEIVDLKTGLATSVPYASAETRHWGNALNDHVFSLSYEKDDGSYQMFYDLYRRSDGACFLSDAVFVEHYGDRIAAATSTHSYLLDETGNVLICLKNNKLV